MAYCCAWHDNCNRNNRDLLLHSVLVDSSASHCFANAFFCQQIGLRFMPLSAELHVANGETVPVVGSVRVQVKVQQYTEQLTLFVTDLAERYAINSW